MGYKRIIALVILFSFISPLAAVSGQPSLFKMLSFYKAKFGDPDHLVLEFCITHNIWVKRTYIWDDKFLVVFLWRRGKGWVIIGMKNLVPVTV